MFQFAGILHFMRAAGDPIEKLGKGRTHIVNRRHPLPPVPLWAMHYRVFVPLPQPAFGQKGGCGKWRLQDISGKFIVIVLCRFGVSFHLAFEPPMPRLQHTNIHSCTIQNCVRLPIVSRPSAGAVTIHKAIHSQAKRCLLKQPIPPAVLQIYYRIQRFYIL